MSLGSIALAGLSLAALLCDTRARPQDDAVGLKLLPRPQQFVTAAGPWLSDNCECESEWTCQCCAKFDNNFFNVHQNLCANWNVLPETFEVETSILLNGGTLFTQSFSGNDVPPFCVPLVAGLPLVGCIKMHSLSQHASSHQLHACANATVSFATINFINAPLGCAHIGQRGIELLMGEEEEENEAMHAVRSIER